MRQGGIFTPCDGCMNFEWCRRHGCTTWNDESRSLWERTCKRSTEINDEIDALVSDLKIIEREGFKP